MRRSNNLRKFFLLTNAAFLLPSIPHIANFFLAFENTSQGYAAFFWIGVSYLIAIAIDGTLLWLTHAVSKDTGSLGYRAVIWAFILFLVAFSGYLNWHIAEHNAVAASTNLSGAFIPGVDPIIASMFPVLAIMYAVMARHIFAEVKVAPVISLEELKQKAAEAQERAAAQVAIIKATNMVNEERATTAIGFGKTLWNKAVNNGKKEVPTTDEPQEQNTNQTPAMNAEDTIPITDDAQEQEQDEALAQETRSKRTTRTLSLSVKETALRLGVSDTRVRELRNKGKLRSPSRNAKLITIRSIEEYAKIRETQGQTGEMKTIKPQDYAEAKAS